MQPPANIGSDRKVFFIKCYINFNKKFPVNHIKHFVKKKHLLKHLNKTNVKILHFFLSTELLDLLKIKINVKNYNKSCTVLLLPLFSLSLSFSLSLPL